MSFDYHLALAGLIVGFCVGLTGMGGGALMTPVLVLGFGITPSAAVSSDIVASAVMKPFGSAIHAWRGTVNIRLVGWLAMGSVPAAFSGVFVIRSFGDGETMQNRIKLAMGAALLVAAAAMAVKAVLDRRAQVSRRAPERVEVEVKRLRTIGIGVVGGLLVGMTSVGAGTVVIVLLMLVYPTLPMRQIVGTDLMQAIPLVAAAAVSHALFGDLQFALTTAVTVGGVVGVILGALVSSRAPNGVIRPALAFLLLASALKLLGVTTPVVGAILAGVALAVGAGLVRARLSRRHAAAEVAATGASEATDEAYPVSAEAAAREAAARPS